MGQVGVTAAGWVMAWVGGVGIEAEVVTLPRFVPEIKHILHSFLYHSADERSVWGSVLGSESK